MKTKNYKFITGSILLIISLLTASFWINQDKNEYKSITSIQPEINSVKAYINSNELQYKLCVSMFNSIEKKIIQADSNTTKLGTQITELNVELNKFNDKTIKDLIKQIESKALAFTPQNNSELQWIEKAFNWPIIFIYLIISLVYYRLELAKLVGLFGNVKSVNLFGNGIEFGENVKIESELSIKKYRSRINDAYNYQIQKEQLNDKLRYLVEDVKEYLCTVGTATPDELKLRCTIHIQDLLIQESLYQLLDYYPKSNGGAGRIKSIRFGIIGLAWRTEKTQIRGNVDNSQNQLIKDWGLDMTESTSNSDLKSFSAIILKSNDGIRLGVVYLDSNQPNLFGDLENENEKEKSEKFEQFISEKSDKRGITKSLSNLKDNLSDKFLQINIYE